MGSVDFNGNCEDRRRAVAYHRCPACALAFTGDFAQRGMDWWCVAPRDGHVTIRSAQNLRVLWAE